MSTDIARAFFVGRLTRDIEVLFSGSGNLFGVITLAVNVYQGKNQPEKTSFFRVTVPGRTVDAIGTWLTKGRQVAVDAVPVMSSWTDANNTRKTRVQFEATSIQLLSSGKGAADRRSDQDETEDATAEKEPEHETVTRENGTEERFIDDMPF